MFRQLLIIPLLLCCTLLKAQQADSALIARIAGTAPVFVGKKTDIKKLQLFSTSSYAYKKRLFSPVAVTYIAEVNSLDNTLFADKVIYFNTDTSGKVAAVVLEVLNEAKLADTLKAQLGEFTHSNSFGTAGAMSSARGWLTKDYCILLLSSDRLALLIVYNCDKKSFME